MARDFLFTVSAFGLQRLAFNFGEVLAGIIFLGLFLYFGIQWNNKLRNRV
jgi:hypothetical protein